MSLHQKFIGLAKEKNTILYKLLALLPEIYESGEYKKYAHTIQGYALQYGQIPESTVNKVLKLEKYFKQTPMLKEAVRSVGVHKVAIVASVVTPENESVIVEKLKSMSTQALQELSKEMRGRSEKVVKSFELNSRQQAIWNLLLKQFDVENDDLLLDKILNCAVELTECKEEVEDLSAQKKVKRYIPVKAREKVISKYNKKCAYPSCQKNFDHLHHQEKFAKVKNHKKLVPLCKVHHEFVHNNLIVNQLEAPYLWEFNLGHTECPIDKKYQQMRC